MWKNTESGDSNVKPQNKEMSFYSIKPSKYNSIKLIDYHILPLKYVFFSTFLIFHYSNSLYLVISHLLLSLSINEPWIFERNRIFFIWLKKTIFIVYVTVDSRGYLLQDVFDLLSLLLVKLMSSFEDWDIGGSVCLLCIQAS